VEEEFDGGVGSNSLSEIRHLCSLQKLLIYLLFLKMLYLWFEHKIDDEIIDLWFILVVVVCGRNSFFNLT